MFLNETYYQTLWRKFENVKTLNVFNNNTSCLTTKLILEHYNKNQPIHINFQEFKDILCEIGKHLFVEFSNDIYLNHYDLPDNFSVGDKLKRIADNQYYEIISAGHNNYTLRQVLRKTSYNVFPVTIPNQNYDRLTKFYLKVDSGISEKTIKNYFSYFENLNSKKIDFPRINFEKKIVFISKKILWDCLADKNKIPSTYLPNPREENNVSEIRSIPALHDCLVYFTPKYEVCYQNLLLKNEKIKAIVLFDTEVDQIEQILQDKPRFGFNIIVISNSFSPMKNQAIPCWNWFKEEIEIVNAL